MSHVTEQSVRFQTALASIRLIHASAFLYLTEDYFDFLTIFFFNDTATTEIYTLSLHDALPISASCATSPIKRSLSLKRLHTLVHASSRPRSEEHTSELQSLAYLVCRLLLEKKNDAVQPLIGKKS